MTRGARYAGAGGALLAAEAIDVMSGVPVAAVIVVLAAAWMFARAVRTLRLSGERATVEPPAPVATASGLPQGVEPGREGEYIALVSHDLRAPLATIALQGEILERAVNDGPLASEARAVHSILRNARRMGRMIDDLLDAARLDAGRLEVARERIEVGALVRGALQETLGPHDAARVRYQLPDRGVYVSGDRCRLERVLINLVSNALKYSPSPRPVVVRLAVSAGEVLLSVRDEGRGIAAEDQAHVFEKFHPSRHRAAGSVGLGLYTTRALVEAHGGRVSVASAPGRGATFTVTLPASRPTPAAGFLAARPRARLAATHIRADGP